MPRHHLGISADDVICMGGECCRVRRCIAGTLEGASNHVTDSVFAAVTSSTPNQFVGATFVPSIAPTVNVVHQANATTLSWQPVSVTGTGVVSYVVQRISPNGTSVIVCTGADAPVLQSSGLMRCIDGGSGGRRNLSYSQQPVIVRNGVSTWSLEPSVPARELVVVLAVFRFTVDVSVRDFPKAVQDGNREERANGGS